MGTESSSYETGGGISGSMLGDLPLEVTPATLGARVISTIFKATGDLPLVGTLGLCIDDEVSSNDTG